jgi:PAS domain S-box-containing protein
VIPRRPITLRPSAHEGESLLVPTDQSSVPNPSLKTIPLPRIKPFSPSNEAADEIQKLREELAECRRGLEAWTQAEADWSRQRRLFKVMTENVSDLIVLMDRQGHRVWNNPAYSHLMGYEPEELAGTYALLEVDPEDQPRATEALDKALTEGTSQEVEFRVQQKHGSWIHLQTEMVPIIETDGQVSSIVLMGHDITEKKHLSEALAMASTQATAAGMAEGMARDFDQVLTNVFGNLTIAKNLNGPHNAIAVRLNEMERSLQRARDLIEQMFSISAGSDQPKVRVKVEAIVQEAVASVLRGTMIRAEYLFPRALPELEIDVEAFSHAVRNIMTNCVEAMDKGVVRVSADTVSQEQLSHRPDIPLKAGNYVCLKFRDQGHGITEKALPRVFEPYFTTRQGSQGLGLTTALSSIQRMGGTILMESTPSVGTTVSIFVPIAHGFSSSTASSSGPGVSSTSSLVSPTATSTGALPKPRDKKRILLMDDEQMILDIVSRMLGHLGYEVTTCTDGSQAIAAFAKAKSHAEFFDVVVMDLVIPNGVGGQDAVHTIRKIDPNAKVIASSGHLDHPVMIDHSKFGFTASLEKPYKLEKLQQVIEAVINAGA